MLSFLYWIFDPLGFLNPCLLGVKLLIQDLRRKKLHWDDSLPSDLLKKWKYIQENFSYVYKIKVPRFYGFSTLKATTELHFFSDCSSHAFGCIFPKYNIIYSKTWVASSRASELNVNCILFWTDSKTVFKYIRTDNKRFPVFVTRNWNIGTFK